MVECSQIQETLSAAADDELSVEDRALLEAHLASCTRCQAELEAVQALRHRVQRLPLLEVPGNFWAAVCRRLDQLQPKPLPWYAPARLAFDFAMAALIVGVYFGLSYRWQQRQALPRWTSLGIFLRQHEATTIASGGRVRVPPDWGRIPRGLSFYTGYPVRTFRPEQIKLKFSLVRLCTLNECPVLELTFIAEVPEQHVVRLYQVPANGLAPKDNCAEGRVGGMPMYTKLDRRGSALAWYAAKEARVYVLVSDLDFVALQNIALRMIKAEPVNV